MLTGRGAVSLSSFGGEGQGEEVVVLCKLSRYVGAATRWNIATNHSIEKGDGPPLPNPLLQRRRGRTTRPLLASAKYVYGAGLGHALVLAFVIERGTAIAPGMMGEPQRAGKLILDAALPERPCQGWRVASGLLR